MSKPTQQDAELYLQFKNWQKNMGFFKASRFLWSDDFPLTLKKYEEQIEGTKDHKYAVIYVQTLETLGAYYKHGLINPDLLFDIESFEHIWDRFKDLIIGIRERDNFPGFLEWFEFLVEKEKEWRKK